MRVACRFRFSAILALGATLSGMAPAECTYCIEIHRDCLEITHKDFTITNDVVTAQPSPATDIFFIPSPTRTVLDPGWESLGCGCDLEDAIAVGDLVVEVRFDRSQEYVMDEERIKFRRVDEDGVIAGRDYTEVTKAGIVRITESCLDYRCDAEAQS